MHVGLSLCPEVGRWADTVAQARLAEELGFDSVWLPEHHLMAGYAPAPLLGLAGLAGLTKEIQLGSDIVVAPFYHPVRLAEDAAVLHEMSGGRMILGVGLGYRPEEFAALGVPYAERGSRLTETLAIVERLWREERVCFEGTHFTLKDVTIYPRLPDPPPLWVGGWSAAAVRRAARYGDAWFPGPTADLATVAKSLSGYDSALQELGRKRAVLPIFREVFVADSPELLEAGLAPMLRLYQSDYQTWGHSNVASSADIAANRFIVGDVDTVAAGIAELREELGVTHLIARLHCHGVEESAVERSMRLLAEQVRPLVDAVGHREVEP